MNKPSKCKNCQWYGKPYWSIINPCDNCPMENVETFTMWQDPTIEEYQKEIARLNKIIDELGKDLEYKIKEFEKDGYDLPSVRQQSLWLAGCYDEDKLILQELKELKEEGKKDE